MEMIAEDNQRIGRPRQLYVGPDRRDYIEINKRHNHTNIQLK
jgi:citrate synthase